MRPFLNNKRNKPNRNPSLSGDDKKEKNEERKRWKTNLFVTVIIGTATIFVPIFCNQLSEEKKTPELSKIKEQPKSCCPFEKDSTYNILLFHFWSYVKSDTSVLCELAIRDRLIDFSSEKQLNLDVRIEDSLNTKSNPINNDFAKKIGHACNSNLMIWGNYESMFNSDTTIICIKFQTLDKRKEADILESAHHSESKKIHSVTSLAQGELTTTIENIVLWAAGIKEYESGDLISAVNYFKQIKLDAVYQKHTVLNAIGETYFKMGDYKNATEYYLLSEKSFDNVIASSNLATLHTLDSTTRTSDDKTIANKQIYIEPLIQDTPPPFDYSISSQEYYKRGHDKLWQKDWGKKYFGQKNLLFAITNFKNALYLNPNHKEALIDLGNAFFLQSKYDSALKYYSQASLKYPHELIINYNLACVYYNKYSWENNPMKKREIHNKRLENLRKYYSDKPINNKGIHDFEENNILCLRSKKFRLAFENNEQQNIILQ